MNSTMDWTTHWPKSRSLKNCVDTILRGKIKNCSLYTKLQDFTMFVRPVTLLRQCSIIGLTIGLPLWILTKLFWSQEGSTAEARNDPKLKILNVDIVYMWVNGSDPALLESIDYHVAKLQHQNIPVETQVSCATWKRLFVPSLLLDVSLYIKKRLHFGSWWSWLIKKRNKVRVLKKKCQ